VIFAEPVTGNTNKQLDAALLPGDRLLEVNGQNVQNTNREDIIDIIRNSGSTVTLKVVHGLYFLNVLLFSLIYGSLSLFLFFYFFFHYVLRL
jgi:hypothetical protein